MHTGQHVAENGFDTARDDLAAATAALEGERQKEVARRTAAGDKRPDPPPAEPLLKESLRRLASLALPADVDPYLRSLFDPGRCAPPRGWLSLYARFGTNQCENRRLQADEASEEHPFPPVHVQ
jgi:hypothetical protein